MLQDMTKVMFGHLSKEEHKRLADLYLSGDEEEKRRLDEAYGEPFMQFYTSEKHDMNAFAALVKGLNEERKRVNLITYGDILSRLASNLPYFAHFKRDSFKKKVKCFPYSL